MAARGFARALLIHKGRGLIDKLSKPQNKTNITYNIQDKDDIGFILRLLGVW